VVDILASGAVEAVLVGCLGRDLVLTETEEGAKTWRGARICDETHTAWYVLRSLPIDQGRYTRGTPNPQPPTCHYDLGAWSVQRTFDRTPCYQGSCRGIIASSIAHVRRALLLMHNLDRNFDPLSRLGTFAITQQTDITVATKLSRLDLVYILVHVLVYSIL
jgi:hypothetical protein